MTSPNLSNPNQRPDAVNAGDGISAAAAQSRAQFLQGRMNGVGGPLGPVVAWMLDGVAGPIIDAAEESVVEGTESITFDNIAERVFEEIVDIRSQVTGPLKDLLDALLGDYTGGDSALLQIQSWAAGLGGLVGAVLGGLPDLWPVGSATDEIVNILWNPSFEGAVSVEGDGTWFWDEATGRTAAGAVYTDADGTDRTLLSERHEVRQGQKLRVGGHARWSGVTAGAGECFAVRIAAFDADEVLVSSTTLGSVSSPAASSGSSWVAMEGNWTVPAGVRYVRVQIVVTGAVTAGRVHFDDMLLAHVGRMPQRMVDGLEAALTALGDWLETLVDQLLGALGLPALGGLFDKISDLSDEIDAWRGDTEARAGQLADLIGDLLANPASRLGMIPQGKITGLADTLANLAANFGGLLEALTGDYTGSDTALAGIQSWAEQVGEDITEALDGIEGATTAAVNAVIEGMNNTGAYAAAIMAAISAAINQTIANIFGDGGTKWGQEVLVASGPVTTGPNDIPLGFGMPFSGKITDLSFYSSDHVSTGSGSKLTVEVRKNGSTIRTEDWTGGTNSKNVTGLNLSVAKYDRITFWVTTATSQAANMSVSVMGAYV
ncbi:hypothetical protein C6V83_18030 [Gordonia iterans]|uniref:Minor tail protein n=1 Tax=Gordonia iterans TaxID=1004901 RepID=A0A2S0KJM4_9ACTN|nr:hypothetical protein [Gordonia iterans]AVM01877.1 hypothetical protein C6V83_18030 [Gordonia iterans]